MVTWQRRSSLGSRRVMSVTAFGAVLSFLLSPYYRAALSSCFLGGGLGPIGAGLCAIHPSSWYGVSRKFNFRFTEFSEVRRFLGAPAHIHSPKTGVCCPRYVA